MCMQHAVQNFDVRGGDFKKEKPFAQVSVHISNQAANTTGCLPRKLYTCLRTDMIRMLIGSTCKPQTKESV
jgi:hypothetical protein